MISKLREFFSEVTNTYFSRIRGLILIVHSVVIIAILALAIMDISRIFMVFLGAFLLAAFFLSYIGYIGIGSWTTLFASLIVFSMLFFMNGGVRDTAFIGLIVVLIASGLLAGTTGTLVSGGIIISEIVIYGVLEARGVLVNPWGLKNQLADYFAVIIAISLLTTFQWLVISLLNRNIQQAKEELAERLKVQAQLQEAEARYRGLVESIPVVIYMAEPGAAGPWKYVSPQIFQLMGYTVEEWQSDPSLWLSRVHPDDRERVLNEGSKALLEGQMPKSEYRMLTRNNRRIWVYDEGLVMVDADKIIVQGFLLDITSRKQAEQQLKSRIDELKAVHGISDALMQNSDLKQLIYNTGEQIRLAFKANNVLIGIHDPNTDLIHFPYDYEDGVQRKDTPIRYGEGMTTQIMKMRKPVLINTNWDERSKQLNVLRTNKVPTLSSFMIPIISMDKTFGVINLENTEKEFAFDELDTRPLLTIASNLAVAIEKTRLQDSLKQELEIQERLINELEMKNEELERFSYTASHDLKSPLITIRGFLGYLEEDARNGNFERLHSDIQRISEATEKMHQLLRELLELSRVGRVANKKDRVPFEVIIQEALKRVAGQLKERNILVRTGSGFPSVEVDKERLIEVVQNLVDNAIKFTGSVREPDIEINHFIQNDAAVFYVRDNGIGIKKEFQQRIFGLFDKLDASSEGTGVGLALVKRIIEVHGGKIWVESDEGAGTTFYFTLGASEASP
ncbi:PAS domain S-box protein [Chloroflexota bacterium]